MTTLTTTTDIINDVLFRAGEPTDNTSDFESHVLDLVNRAYRAIWTGGGEFVEDMNEPWLWLKKDPPGVLILQPSIRTGTVSVTNNSASITFSSAPAASVAGYHFRTDDDGTVYRISAHTGGAAAATLDSVYTGLNNTAAAFRLMKLEYSLAADAMRVIAPMRVQTALTDEIDGIDLSALDLNYPLTSIEGGVPDKFAPVTESKVRFNRYGGELSTDLLRVEYDYLAEPTALTDDVSSIPLVPLSYRQIIADIALFYLFTGKSDARAETIGAQARAGLKAMASDNRARMKQYSRSFGQVYQRGRWTSTRSLRILVTG